MCYDHKSGANLYTLPEERNKEHDKVRSRLTGNEHEIEFSPMGGGFVPRNPFASSSQMRKFFAMEGRGELPKGTAERWAHETPDIKHLPKHVKK